MASVCPFSSALPFCWGVAVRAAVSVYDASAALLVACTSALNEHRPRPLGCRSSCIMTVYPFLGWGFLPSNVVVLPCFVEVVGEKTWRPRTGDESWGRVLDASCQFGF